MRDSEVVVIGAGGAQAQAMLEAAGRAGTVTGWVGVDRAWREREKYACEEMGMRTVELDLLEQPDQLRELALDASLVANFAGPYYRTGTAVLEACIEAGCDYLDICDDADATLEMLAMDEAARAAGVRALVGMGSSPGVTNVLVRAARDWLGEADEVALSWIVDVADVNDAALQHLWHIFSPVGSDGERQPVPAWEDLSLRTVEFPPPLGERMVIGLSHPEPITIPRFLGIETVRNFGSIVPEDSLLVNWSLARLGASGGIDDVLTVDGSEVPIPTLASGLYRRYLKTRSPTDYLGGGLVVDVWSGEEGVRFASADKTSMDESTGVPAAAGIVLLLEGGPEEPGVMAPECLDPAEFFPRLGRSSRGTGSLGAYRLWGSEQGVRIRIRDLLKTRTR
ncbi:MAG TPA: saccharopine dehydrogenase NADP-binding domain-containing protein [Solirubrobacterales bacterium]|nr:saccharopine dehydrogenase NADP-binding domain-containing protein [Solirubrobacterales bacterium]